MYPNKNELKLIISIFFILTILSPLAEASIGDILIDNNARVMSSGDFWDLEEGYRLSIDAEDLDVIFFTVTKNGEVLKREGIYIEPYKESYSAFSYFIYKDDYAGYGKGEAKIIWISSIARLENKKVRFALSQWSDGTPLNGVQSKYIPIPSPNQRAISPLVTPLVTQNQTPKSTPNDFEFFYFLALCFIALIVIVFFNHDNSQLNSILVNFTLIYMGYIVYSSFSNFLTSFALILCFILFLIMKKNSYEWWIIIFIFIIFYKSIDQSDQRYTFMAFILPLISSFHLLWHASGTDRITPIRPARQELNADTEPTIISISSINEREPREPPIGHRLRSLQFFDSF